jgi:two-component sensor histidine kinase
LSGPGQLPAATEAEQSAGDRVDVELKLLELRHRTKNILTIVNALVHQTLQGDVSLDAARDSLSARVIAMGTAVDLLMRSDWKAASLEDLAKLALAQFGSDRERTSIDGPPTMVGPDAAMMIVLSLHELETNAIKYGALSVPDGRVSLSWSLSDEGVGRRLQLRWREHDGPAVSAPERTGFGSRLTSALISRRLSGTALVEYDPAGLRWTFDAPLSALEH